MLKELFDTWRHNIALHATLEIKRISPINNNERDLVRIGAGDQNNPLCLKLQGVTQDGIDVYIDVELLGTPEMLNKFRFAPGKHVGLVLRVID